MADIIKADGKNTISKEKAQEGGVTATSDEIVLTDDNLAVSGDSQTVKQEDGGDWFVSDRALHLTKDDKVVEEDDLAGVKVLVGKGGRLTSEEAAKYGLGKQSKGKRAEASSPSPGDDDDGKPKRGKLPDDFPHAELLKSAGITTYAKARDLKGDYSSIEGIGEARGAEIDEALAD